MGESAARAGLKEATIGERAELRQARTVEDGSRGDTEHRRPLDDFSHFVLLRPGVDDVVEL